MQCGKKKWCDHTAVVTRVEVLYFKYFNKQQQKAKVQRSIKKYKKDWQNIVDKGKVSKK